MAERVTVRFKAHALKHLDGIVADPLTVHDDLAQRVRGVVAAMPTNDQLFLDEAIARLSRGDDVDTRAARVLTDLRERR